MKSVAATRRVSLRNVTRIPTLTAVLLSACQSQAPPAAAASILDSAGAGAIADSVRAFAATVALGVTTRGPAAWRDFFADDPAFFMASEGRLVFPNSDSAGRAIQGLTTTITHIELHWGDALRVDPLGPGLAVLAAPYHESLVVQGRHLEEEGYLTGVVQHGAAGWQFRNAHWSVVTPAPAP